MASRALGITGLKEFRRELRAIEEGALTKELKGFHKKLAEEIAAVAQGRARALGGVHAKAAPAIKGYATQAGAAVGVLPNSRFPMAAVAFWGAKAHTGWFAHIDSDARQHPPWVGAGWTAGVRGQGPYAINHAVATVADELPERYAAMLMRLAARAFPDE